MRKLGLIYAKTKAQISCAVTDHAFVFTTRIVQYLLLVNPKFQASSLRLQARLCRIWSEIRRRFFSRCGSNDLAFMSRSDVFYDI